ncbi:MAG: hypothetical protein M1826_005792 [Phylliscum demangeonii]|nr:MAG: hypothetical protein M1826_005792 [Phylliscum demangeonii]
MSSDKASSHPRSGLGALYANLLDPSTTGDVPASSASFSRPPVVFKTAGEEPQQQDDGPPRKPPVTSAALRFQPMKRPQLPGTKSKAKPSIPKAAPPRPTTDPASQSQLASGATAAARPPVKSTLADWTGVDDDVNGFYNAEKRARGGRKKRKKNKEEVSVPQDWDDIYDPTRPNSYEEYKDSEEKIREVREWKDRLYAHRMLRKHSSDIDSEDEGDVRLQRSRQFAPPSDHSVAPLPDFDVDRSAATVAPPPLQAIIADDKTGDGADVRLRYRLPAPPSEIPATEAELEAALRQETATDGEDEQSPANEERSLRPGQRGFAARLMAKYGWTKGSGLGASGTGIVNPLRVQVEKQTRRPDAEGGRFVAGTGARGKIVGGHKKKTQVGNEDQADGEDGLFGRMSEVVVLKGMVDGMDLDDELHGMTAGGGLMQEIGEECGEKYGRVERVYIHRGDDDDPDLRMPLVFVKFTSQLSGLRAVNALEGRIFNGNTITARFFDAEKFEAGVLR